MAQLATACVTPADGATSTMTCDLRVPPSNNILTPRDRRQALTYMRWADHGILRMFWHNMHEIAPDVWRSNYPDAARIARLARQGIATIITLRGTDPTPWQQLEAEACSDHGIALHGVSLKSTAAPSRCAMMELIALFRHVEKPLLIHCKSGADRAGLASAIYLMVIAGQPVSIARRMLAIRYLHLPILRTGVLGRLLDEFAASGETDFECWVTNEYNAKELQGRFDAGRWLSGTRHGKGLETNRTRA